MLDLLCALQLSADQLVTMIEAGGSLSFLICLLSNYSCLSGFHTLLQRWLATVQQYLYKMICPIVTS